MEQNNIIPQLQQDAIQTAGDFYGMVIPEEDLKRRRPIHDFKAGAEWQYRYLATEMEAMKTERDAYRAALQEIEDPTKFIQARADAEGKPMDGQRAFALSFDPVYLRGIATLALKQFNNQ